MRPRKTRLNLPRNVYFKHGAFYRVENGKWIRLGERIEDAGIPDALAEDVQAKERSAMERFIGSRVAHARQSAKVRGLEFQLTTLEAVSLLRAAKWKCAVTGTRFTMEVIKGRRPYAPSIDRKDSDLGYSVANCRITCVIANIAMNVWGDEALRRIAKNMSIKREVLDTSGHIGQTSNISID